MFLPQVPVSVTATKAVAAYQANHAVVSQVIADTSAGLLASLSGLTTLMTANKITSIALTGTANKVTAAQAAQLAALTRLTLGSGATLVVADTATNLLAGAASLGVATAVQLIGDNTVNATQAKALVGLIGFSQSSSAVLHVVDSAANLLNPANAAGVAAATYALAAGSFNTVTAAQIATLAALPKFGLQSGATLSVVDTAAALLANAASIAKYSTVTTLSGSNTVSSSQAIALVGLRGFTVGGGATLTVSDTAATLLASKAAWLGKATSVMLSGTSNVVTAAQAASLAALTGFSLAPGATLVVTDSAVNLLSSSRAAGMAKATSVSLTGTSNTVTAAQAQLLSGMASFGVANGAALTVSDVAQNLLSGSYAAGIAKANSVTLVGDSTVDVAHAITMIGLAGFTKASGAVLHVVDTAANLLNPANAPAITIATYTLITGTANVVTAAQATALAALPGFGGVPGSTLSVIDTAANVLANITAVSRYASNTVLTGTNTVTAAQAATLATAYHETIANGASLLIVDTFANFGASVANLTLPPGYGVPAGYTSNLSQVPVQFAASVQTQGPVVGFQVSDTAANLNGSALVALNFDDKLTAITPTDQAALRLTYTQMRGLGHALSLITGNFSMIVTDVPVAAAAALQANPLVQSFSVTDNFADVSVAYFQLHSYNKLTTVYPTLSATYDPAQVSTLGMYAPKILTIAAVPMAAVDTLQAIASVAGLTVTDTAANLTAGLSSLRNDADITGINATGTNGADVLLLSGTVASAQINLNGNSAAVAGGLSMPSLSFDVGTADVITLGAGPSTINYLLAPTSGLEVVTGFIYGVDTLKIGLNGAMPGTVEAFDTTVSGQRAVTITSSTDETHGVVLVNVPQSMNAAGLIANHLTSSGGVAVIA